MNLTEISCPSKTYVLGEYGVLDGGPAVLLNTAPRFKCLVGSSARGQARGQGQDQTRGAIEEIAESSPAGQWARRHSLEFSGARLKWSDPFEGRGGFGFSSAQFDILYACHALWQGRTIDQIKPQEIWRAYKSLKFEGQAPSGADAVSQWVGGVCVFEQEPLAIESLTHSLPDLECLIARIPAEAGAAADFKSRAGSRKASARADLRTYEYLKSLKLPDVSDLKRIAAAGAGAVKGRDEEGFLEAINSCRRALEQKGFVAPPAKEALEKLSGLPEIKAMKGCGAMSAGAIIVFHKKEHEDYLREKMSFLEIIADTSALTYGIEAHKVTAPPEAAAKK